MAALETLAIIAYRQPLTAPEVSDLRGALSTTVIKTLLERRMIRIVGRKQVVGKPFLYATTREFLLHFGLGSLGDLPPLEEMEELFSLEGSGGEALPFDREEEVARESAALDEAEPEEGEPEEREPAAVLGGDGAQGDETKRRETKRRETSVEKPRSGNPKVGKPKVGKPG